MLHGSFQFQIDPRRSFPLLAVVAIIAMAAIGFVSLPGPDQTHDGFTLLLTMLGFCLWFASLLSYGCLIVRALNIVKSKGINALFIGSIVMVAASYLFAALGLLSEDYRALFLLFLYAPILYFALGSSNSGISQWRVRKTLLLLVGLTLSFRFLFALIPSSFWDPLWYHLPLVQAWWKTGTLTYPTSHLPFFFSGHWEALFLWPHLLFAGSGEQGIVSVQIFAQLQHLLIGLLGSFLALNQLARIFFGKLLSPWLAFGSLFIFGLIDHATYAKNDWGLIFWLLSLLLFLVQHSRRRIHNPLLWGFLLGIVISSKWSSLFALFSILILYLVVNRRTDWKGVAYVTLAFLLGLLPILTRNYLLVNNPVFPLALGMFSETTLGPTWLQAITGANSVQESSYLQFLWTKLIYLQRQNPLIYLWLLVPIAFSLKQFNARKLRVSLMLLIPIVPYLFLTGTNTEPRYLGAALLLINLFSLGITLKLVLLFLRTQEQRTIVAGALVLALFLPQGVIRISGISMEDILRPELVIRKHIAGSSMAWIRLNAPAGEKIAFLSEGRIYYLAANYEVRRIWDDPILDKMMAETSDPEMRVDKLRALGFRYIIHSEQRIDQYHNADIILRFLGLVNERPNAIVFDSGLSKVIDLEKLAKPIGTE